MKATGIVRKIDSLGRILIPMEIRRTMRIKENDPIEIFTDKEGKIILKKYSYVGEMGEEIREYAGSISKILDCTVCITDTEQVAAVSGRGKKQWEDNYITEGLQQVIRNRKTISADKASDDYVNVIDKEEGGKEQIISPIICNGDAIGSVIFLNDNEKKPFDDTGRKLCRIAAEIIGRIWAQ